MIYIGNRGYRMAGTSVTLQETGSDIIVTQGGQSVDAGPGADITGTAPPLIPSSWWPWILLAAAGLTIWYLAKTEKGGGSSSGGPFVG